MRNLLCTTWMISLMEKLWILLVRKSTKAMLVLKLPEALASINLNLERLVLHNSLPSFTLLTLFMPSLVTKIMNLESAVKKMCFVLTISSNEIISLVALVSTLVSPIFSGESMSTVAEYLKSGDIAKAKCFSYYSVSDPSMRSSSAEKS